MNDEQDQRIADAPDPAPEAPAETKSELATADLAGVKAIAEPIGARQDDTVAQTSAAVPSDQAASPLFAADETKDFRSRWDGIQAGFVDEPRKAVEAADGLVATAMARLAEVFAAERSRLEGQWDRGDDVTTEDLRIALRRYRSFFSRLLSV